MHRRLIAVGLGLGIAGAALLALRVSVALRRDPPPGAEQAVILHVRSAGPRYGPPEGEAAVGVLQTSLAYALEASGAGRVDGVEVRDGEVVLWLYGPRADDVLAAVRPTLDAAELPVGSWANARYGAPADPTATRRRVELGPQKGGVNEPSENTR